MFYSFFLSFSLTLSVSSVFLVYSSRSSPYTQNIESPFLKIKVVMFQSLVACSLFYVATKSSLPSRTSESPAVLFLFLLRTITPTPRYSPPSDLLPPFSTIAGHRSLCAPDDRLDSLPFPFLPPSFCVLPRAPPPLSYTTFDDNHAHAGAVPSASPSPHTTPSPPPSLLPLSSSS